MLARRNLRVKVFQSLYASRLKGETTPQNVKEEFKYNIEQFVAMFDFLLTFPCHFNDYLLSEKDIELEKYFPKEESIKTLSTFDKNPLVHQIEQDGVLKVRTQRAKFNWNNYGEMFFKIYKKIILEPFFIDYQTFDNPTPEQSRDFLVKMYGYLFESNTDFEEEIVNIYLDWDNDVIIFYKMLKACLYEMVEKNGVVPQYHHYNNPADDEEFVETLLVQTVLNEKEYLSIMSGVTSNWDTDRIAKTDIILMQMALTEFMYMPQVPLKVTINEYLDLAKTFSTNRSHVFVNGVLDRIKNILIQENRISKEGRGLRDN
jgi:N utilization substance protein B